MSLLADGAGEEELSALRDRLRRLASADAEHESIDADCQAANEVRRRLVALTRQASTQGALLESVRQLGDLPADIDPVLTAIVARARHLIGCDFTYLSLNDYDAAETYVRVMSGALTEHWRSVRIPFGVGIGGRVAATATPFATPDYINDSRFEHTPDVDIAAVDEKQVAILGVPLVHRGRVIGVLFASNRTPGAFSDEDVDLLTAFAALAAVAIDRAQLLEEKDAALGELRVTLAELETKSRDVRRAVQAHDQAMELILGGGGMPEVVESATKSLGGSLALFNEHMVPLAWTEGLGEEQLHAMRTAAETWSSQPMRSNHVDDLWVTGLVAGSQRLGTIVWCAPEENAPGIEADLRLLERTSVVASLLLLFNHNLALAEARVRGELLDDLLSPSPRGSATLAERARRVGYQPHESQVALALHGAEGLRERLADAAGKLAASRGGLSTFRDGLVLMVVPGTDPGRLAEQIAGSLAPRVGGAVTVGASEVLTDPVDVPRACGEAASCTRALLRLGRAGHYATATDLGFAGLVLAGSASAQSFVDATIGAVVDHDRRKGTPLIRTLEVYFAAGRSLTLSAEELHIHPNTVTQRLNRVGAMLGEGWNSPERSLEVQLALRLHRICPHTADGMGD